MKAENLNLQVMETTLAEWRSKIDELQAKANLVGSENALKTDRQFDRL